MWLHAYELEAKNSLNSASKNKSRLGFWVRKQNSSTKALETIQTYSDFIYWPELGDPEISKLKSVLVETVAQDLDYPFSLSPTDLLPVKSNALISSLAGIGESIEHIQDDKFEVLKFKMGANFKTEYAALMQVNLKSFLVRIDLNHALTFKESKEALQMLKKIPNLEYVEDPTPYQDFQWSELEKMVPLGLDQTSNSKHLELNAPKHFQYRIVKPTRGFSLSQLVQWTYEKKKIVLTNMMDSVVGAWKTYLYFCELKKHIPYHLCTPGFHTHQLFQNFPFAECLGFDGALWTFEEKKLQKLNDSLAKLSWVDVEDPDPRYWQELERGRL